MEIENIITELESLDLSTYPKEQILELFKSVGKVAYLQLILPPGKIIIRARPNKDGERFEIIDDYSFKPQIANKTYQRASTPAQTMFYGTVVSDSASKEEAATRRITGVAETIPMMRDKTMSGYQKISFGRWEVVKGLNLMAIVQKEKFAEATAYIKDLATAYSKYLESIDKEIASRSLAFTSFLAEEFSKSEITGDYDYMISALFSDLAVARGFDGVFYPSTRIGGKGFNIAITPDATKKLHLRAAGECSVYKLRDHTIIGNDSVVELSGTETEFKLSDLPPSRERCLEKLGVSSVEDLV
jgi:hypothetical protein